MGINHSRIGLGLKQTYHLLQKDKYVVHFEHFPQYLTAHLANRLGLAWKWLFPKVKEMGLRKIGDRRGPGSEHPDFDTELSPTASRRGLHVTFPMGKA